MIRRDDDRRWKLIYIHPGQILNLFLGTISDIVLKYTFEGVPENYTIDQINYQPAMQAFEFVIYSKDFDLVPISHYPPKISSTVFHKILER